MKNRILTFVIGLLTGIIITMILCLVYIKGINNANDFNRGPQEFNHLNENMEKPPEERLQK